jgi:hypothetical protein
MADISNKKHLMIHLLSLVFQNVFYVNGKYREGIQKYLDGQMLTYSIPYDIAVRCTFPVSIDTWGSFYIFEEKILMH